jgi:hypothetical protein
LEWFWLRKRPLHLYYGKIIKLTSHWSASLHLSDIKRLNKWCTNGTPLTIKNCSCESRLIYFHFLLLHFYSRSCIRRASCCLAVSLILFWIVYENCDLDKLKKLSGFNPDDPDWIKIRISEKKLSGWIRIRIETLLLEFL